ncbi:MAG: fructose bisphosphate aldolase [Gammaproteobacteria bacterium]|nr:fructose bisphosphate aldolase [Gammaproteobacteria bacterium]
MSLEIPSNPSTDTEKQDRMKFGTGFIAALDQSGGSTPKVLTNYGVPADEYEQDEAKMFDLVHDMRVRIMSHQDFGYPRILGAILFEQTMHRNVNGLNSSVYLWQERGVLPFLKIDNGLAPEANGVQMMKPIQDIGPRLETAKSLDVFGTKMRSVIKEPNRRAIYRVVEQQFDYAMIINEHGLIPIVEPEIDIKAEAKKECEQILLDALTVHLMKLSDEHRVIFKLTLPEVDDFYKEFTDHPKVLRLAALSGGYSRSEAVRRLSRNDGMIASFSRALVEGFTRDMSSESFGKELLKSIVLIADQSGQGEA